MANMVKAQPVENFRGNPKVPSHEGARPRLLSGRCWQQLGGSLDQNAVVCLQFAMCRHAMMYSTAIINAAYQAALTSLRFSEL